MGKLYKVSDGLKSLVQKRIEFNGVDDMFASVKIKFMASSIIIPGKNQFQNYLVQEGSPTSYENNSPVVIL